MEQDRWTEIGRLAELGLLASDLVHELRQMVFAIKALTQVIDVQLDGAEGHANVQMLLSQIDMLEGVLERYARSGRPARDHLQGLEIEPFIEAGALLMQSRARSLRKTIDIDVGGSSRPVWADPVSAQQIVVNLIANALDAAEQTVVVRARDGWLEVRDDGPGISEEVQGRMFEPFFSTKPAGEGTGLGLSITQGLIDRIGGTLRIESSTAGTVFRVEFQDALTKGQADG